MNGTFATFTTLKIVIGSNFNIGRYRVHSICIQLSCHNARSSKERFKRAGGLLGRLSDNEKVISALRVVRGHEGSLSSTVQISYVTAAIYQDSRVRAKKRGISNEKMQCAFNMAAKGNVYPPEGGIS